MSFIDNNLMPDEKVIYRTKLHWIVFLRPVIFLIMAILFTVSDVPPFAVPFVLVFIIDTIAKIFRLFTSEFGITDKRVLVKVGFIKRNTLEIFLSKIEGISVDQGILGRIVGSGTIIVIGTGGTPEPFKDIYSPLIFRQKVQAQIEAMEK